MGNGTTYYYDVFSYSTALAIYSPTPVSGSVTLPNTGLYYIINESHASVSGCTYKLRRKIGAGAYAYKAQSGTTLDDSTAISWADNATLTPTALLGSTGIFDRASSANTEASNVLVRNTTSNGVVSFIEFQTKQSTVYTSMARIGVKDDGKMAFWSTGSIGTAGYDF